MRRAIIILTSLSALMFTVPAVAGPHFLAEGGVGITRGLSNRLTTTPGAGGSVVLGVGGRPAGSWLRYYLLAEYFGGGWGRQHEQNLRRVELQRQLHEFGLGGRIVAPLTPHLRLFADVGLMAVSSSTTLDGPHLAVRDVTDLDFGLRLATGFQYRPIERVSAGLRASVTNTFDGYDEELLPGWLVGFDAEQGHFDVSLNISFYF